VSNAIYLIGSEEILLLENGEYEATRRKVGAKAMENIEVFSSEWMSIEVRAE